MHSIPSMYELGNTLGPLVSFGVKMRCGDLGNQVTLTLYILVASYKVFRGPHKAITTLITRARIHAFRHTHRTHKRIQSSLGMGSTRLAVPDLGTATSATLTPHFLGSELAQNGNEYARVSAANKLYGIKIRFQQCIKETNVLLLQS